MRPTMRIISLSDRPAMSDATWPSWRAYADEWGYEFVTHTATADTTRHPSWSKIKLLYDECRLRYDYGKICMWVDDDIFITNPGVPILDRLDDAFADPATHVVVSADALPGFPLNAGTIAIRVGPFAELWLQEIWHSARPNEFWHDGLEQDAITRWLALRTRSARTEECFLPDRECTPTFLRIVPHRILQSFSPITKPECPPDLSWRPGDFAVHLTPGTVPERLAALAATLRATL